MNHVKVQSGRSNFNFSSNLWQHGCLVLTARWNCTCSSSLDRSMRVDRVTRTYVQRQEEPHNNCWVHISDWKLNASQQTNLHFTFSDWNFCRVMDVVSYFNLRLKLKTHKEQIPLLWRVWHKYTQHPNTPVWINKCSHTLISFHLITLSVWNIFAHMKGALPGL